MEMKCFLKGHLSSFFAYALRSIRNNLIFKDVKAKWSLQLLGILILSAVKM